MVPCQNKHEFIFTKCIQMPRADWTLSVAIDNLTVDKASLDLEKWSLLDTLFEAIP